MAERLLARMLARILARTAHRQIQAQGGTDKDELSGQQANAVAFQKGPKCQQKNQGKRCNNHAGAAHTLRSTLLPSSPCGMNKSTNLKRTRATAFLWAADVHAAAQFLHTPTITPPGKAPCELLEPPMMAAWKALLPSDSPTSNLAKHACVTK